MTNGCSYIYASFQLQLQRSLTSAGTSHVFLDLGGRVPDCCKCGSIANEIGQWGVLLSTVVGKSKPIQISAQILYRHVFATTRMYGRSARELPDCVAHAEQVRTRRRGNNLMYVMSEKSESQCRPYQIWASIYGLIWSRNLIPHPSPCFQTHPGTH
jgi:hypothetical protein